MKSLRTMWSSTDFGASELTRYASAVMMLLAVSGLAFVLLAHRYGIFTATLFSTVVLLFRATSLSVFPLIAETTTTS